MKRILKKAGKVFGQIYLVFCAVLWGIQGFFIFRPYTDEWVTPPPSTIDYEIVVDESKGITSRGYIVNPKLPGPVILFFAGRAEDARSYGDLLWNLQVPVVLPNYRGHGNSNGRPTEKTILADAETTLNMVRAQYPHRPVVLMGDSVGSAVAIRTADSNIAGMVLISPFRSLAHVANRSILRIVPLHFLTRHKFDSRPKLETLPNKVLVVYSKNDEIVLAKETERVLEQIPQADIIVDDAIHAVVIGRNLRRISEWLSENFEN